MARPDGTFERPVQPALSDLLASYLHEQMTRQAAGFATGDSTGEVVPFEAVPVQPVDAGRAWSEAIAVAQHFEPASGRPEWLMPPDWAAVVAAQQPAAALAFSFGNYPQMVRSLQSLLHATELAALLPTGEAAVPSAPGLKEWAATSARERPYPHVLLAAGVLRLTRQFGAAAELLQRCQAAAPAPWQAAWANEQAALAWHSGRVQEAATLWEEQAETVPVLFNRGMAALFLGNPAQAHPLLAKAVGHLSEESGWYHLGHLYLALAEMLS